VLKDYTSTVKVLVVKAPSDVSQVVDTKVIFFEEVEIFDKFYQEIYFELCSVLLDLFKDRDQILQTALSKTKTGSKSLSGLLQNKDFALYWQRSNCC